MSKHIHMKVFADHSEETITEVVKCPDCGAQLRHVAGEDWACSRCKDPHTQSGERYWRVVAPTVDPRRADAAGERSADALDRISDFFDRHCTGTPDCPVPHGALTELEAHLAGETAALSTAERERDEMRYTLRYFVDRFSIQGTADSERYDRALALLARVPSGGEEGR